MAIDADTLKAERDRLKDALRELETEQRKLDTELKKLRQKEIRTKREIEALGTLISMQDTEGGTGGAGDEPA